MVILFVFRIEAISDTNILLCSRIVFGLKGVKSGLDYSKMVIITENDYIGQTDAIVDKDEYNETRNNIEYIKNDAQKYVDEYVNCVLGNKSKYDKKEFERIY